MKNINLSYVGDEIFGIKAPFILEGAFIIQDKNIYGIFIK